VAAVLSAAKRRRLLCSVDTQGSFDKYKGFDLIKANRQETEGALGRILQSDLDYCIAGQEVLDRLGASAAVITRGAEGLSLVATTVGCLHLAAANRSEVFDVTGAGDTIVAVATLAWLAGASPLQAAQLANAAAGLVVRKLGNGTVSPDELERALAPM
jgi:rfaE bifunctional protein kinase chain/domain